MWADSCDEVPEEAGIFEVAVTGCLREAACQASRVDHRWLNQWIDGTDGIERNGQRPFERLRLNIQVAIVARGGRAYQDAALFQMKGNRMVDGEFCHVAPFDLDDIVRADWSFHDEDATRHLNDFSIDVAAVLECHDV